MGSQGATNCEKLRKNFQNQQAIYIEKGAMRVRVRNIRADLRAQSVAAEIEEIPTPGLRSGVFHDMTEATSLRWEIQAGNLTTFSDHNWAMGYGGWSLFFAPGILQGVVDLAARWPGDLDAVDRYKEVIRWLIHNHAYEPSVRVFPE